MRAPGAGSQREASSFSVSASAAPFPKEISLISRVAIEAASASSGGAIRYLSQICPALSEANPDITYYLLNRSAQFAQLPNLPDNFHWIQIPDFTQSIPLRLLWLQTGLPSILKKLKAEVLLAASDVSTLRSPCPMLLMVHNLNPFSPLRGQIWSRPRAARLSVHRNLIRQCARRAEKVIFVSEWSRRAMLPGLGMPLENTEVVPHGVDPVREKSPADESASQGQKFILVVSEVLEHKNLSRLVEAYCSLASSTNRDINLVIAGTISSKNLHQSLESSLVKQGLSQRVKFLGYVPRNELDILYQQAELLSFPSLGETFGLPLVEAMAAGLPVVTSNVTVMPEICGDAAVYFDPLDVADMTRSLAQVLDDPTLRATLIQRGLERARTFSWSDAAHSLLSIMAAASHRR